MFRKPKDKTRKAETSNVEAAPISPVTRDEIALYAYYIWEKEGRPEGRALEHWLHIGRGSPALKGKPIAVELGRLFSSFSFLRELPPKNSPLCSCVSITSSTSS